jgi:hypothetical protein
MPNLKRAFSQLDFNDPLLLKGFKKEATDQGLPEDFTQGILAELLKSAARGMEGDVNSRVDAGHREVDRLNNNPANFRREMADLGRERQQVRAEGTPQAVNDRSNMVNEALAQAKQMTNANNQQKGYMLSQQRAMQQHPELAQAGSAHNQAFLNLVNENGGAAAMRSNPNLLAQLASQSKPQTSIAATPAQAVAASPAPTPAASPAPAPSTVQHYPSLASQAPAPAMSGNSPIQGGGDLLTGGSRLASNAARPLREEAAPERPFSLPTGPSTIASGAGTSSQQYKPTPAAQAPSVFLPQTALAAQPVAPIQPQPYKPTQPAAAVQKQTAANPLQSGSIPFGGGLHLATPAIKPPNPLVNHSQVGSMSGMGKSGAEKDYLNHLRTELYKMASSLGDSCKYSREDIERITSSSEAFTKAAQEEALLVWTGIEDTLRKEGMDEDFILGMKKEAGFLSLLPAAGTMLRNPWAALKAGWGTLRQGKALSQAALSNAPKGVTPLLDDAGKAIADSIKPVTGARTHGYVDALQSNIKNPSPRDITSLNEARTGAVGEMNKHFATEGQNAFQKHVFDLSEAAKGTGPEALKAQKGLDMLSKGDFQRVEKSMGMNSGGLKAQGFSPEVRQNAVDYGKDYGKELATKGTHKATPYSYSMSPEAARGGYRPGMSLPMKAALGVAGAGALAGGAGLAGAGYLGYQGVKGLSNMIGGGGSSAPDASGLTNDRNRAVPFMSNKFSGGVGGALLGMLMANEMGLQGPASWALPLIGGIAGHNYLPQMMNKWKDPYGTGVNQISPAAAAYNQQFPLGGG